MPGNRLTEEVVYGIVTNIRDMRAANAPINARELARKWNVSKNTVYNIIHKINNNLPLIKKTRNKPRTSIAPQDIIDVVNLSQGDPWLPASTIKSVLDLNCSVTTIKRVLAESDQKSYHAAYKELITDRHKRLRLLWGGLNLNRNWNLVIFSDESSICQNEHGFLRVRRPLGTRYEQRYLAHIRRSGRVSVSCWGFMYHNGFGGLVRINGNLNGVQYCQILTTHLIPFMNANPGLVFQQDKSPVHSSNRVQNFLANNNINVLPWEAKMADMNPMGKLL